MLFVDRFSRYPIYEQVVNAMEREIVTDMMEAGEALPSIRELSGRLQVNPNTMQKAYAELARRGLICASKGSGYYVTEDAKERIRHQKEKELTELEGRVRELYMAGIKREQILDAVNRVYAQNDLSQEETK